MESTVTYITLYISIRWWWTIYNTRYVGPVST